ncbi:MAG: hypothetical protein M1143_04685 [Candidatus Thermoplasmatota archaeon]|nr:hypothetical protein [Candidatus Thermoplasmatota archaeon]
MKFDDPHFHLLTMKGVDKSIRDLTHASVYIVFGLAPVRTYVTQAAYAELLAKARTLGLRVEEKHYRQPEWTYVTIGAG